MFLSLNLTLTPLTRSASEDSPSAQDEDSPPTPPRSRFSLTPTPLILPLHNIPGRIIHTPFVTKIHIPFPLRPPVFSLPQRWRASTPTLQDAKKDGHTRFFPRLSLISTDCGYAGKLIEWIRALGGCSLQIVKRNDDLKGFAVLPGRWIVERTFAWLGTYRRLSKDYETLTDSSKTIIRIAMIYLMIHRLKAG